MNEPHQKTRTYYQKEHACDVVELLRQQQILHNPDRKLLRKIELPAFHQRAAVRFIAWMPKLVNDVCETRQGPRRRWLRFSIAYIFFKNLVDLLDVKNW